MKRYAMIVGAMAMALSVQAESYSALWKQYKSAEEKDQPKTAIAVLRKIQKKAQGEKSYGNLLAALTRELRQHAEVSEDSLNARRAMLKAQSKAWHAKGEGVLATLCDVAACQFGEGKDVANIDSLLASKDAGIYTKTNATAAYVPFLEEGKSSQYCNNDLLHVIGLHTGQYDALMHYYGAQGNGKAVCFIAPMSIELLNKEKELQKLDSLISLYGNLPECGALALPKLELLEFDANNSHGFDGPYGYDKERTKRAIDWIDEALRRWPTYTGINILRNSRAERTLPQYTITTRLSEVNTTMPVVFRFENVRNVDALTLTLKSDKGAVRTFKHAFAKHEEYEVFSDTLDIGRLPLGKWTVSAVDGKGSLSQTAGKPLSVTDLRVVSQVLPEDSTRYVVVNDATGQPVQGATIRFVTTDKAKTVTTAITDVNGEYIRKVDGKTYDVSATKGEDTAAPTSPRNYGWRFGTYTPRDTVNYSKTYTDRSIYRPGQTVHAVLVRSLLLSGTETKVKGGETFKAVLYNADRKQVGEPKTVTTDEYGTAAVDFVLPQEGKNGQYHIAFQGASANAYFSVEEYKRPVFGVSIDAPKQDYKDGDTLHVKGYAKTYSGVAVANARVAYKVSQGYSWWWRKGGNDVVLTDTVYTQADGSFTMTMPMTLPKQDKDGSALRCCFYNVQTEATVTDAAGESHTATLSLPLSNRNAYLSCDLKGTLLADTLIVFTPKRVNARGTAIEGTVKVCLDGKPLATAQANKKYTLPKTVASGKHTIQLVCEGDTVNCDFVAFRRSDTVPMTYTHDWFYASSGQFDEKTGEAWIQYGSSDKDVHVVYTIVANGKVLERSTTTLDNSVRTRTFIYKKEYGNGISVSMAWVKDGKVYQHTATITRPLPSKKLTMEWGTFRNKLQPGQKEVWTLKIKNPDGTPAKAQTMAVLYDKSLDAIKPHAWTVSDPRSISVPVARWNSRLSFALSFGATGKYTMLDSPVEQYTVIADDCRWGDLQARPRYFLTRGSLPMMKSAALGSKMSLASAAPMALMDTEEKMAVGMAATNAADETAEEQKPAEQIYRENFNETAFFMPALVTDAKGSTSLRFTLPESVTTWRFMAVAHDKEMRQALMTDEAVAQKQLMIQPRMPRFLRKGDKATVSASVANLSEKTMSVKATMTLLDPYTERVIAKQEKTVAVKAGETGNATFDFSPTDTLSSYICRFSAEAPGYTDGEQHLLPVLSDEEEVTETRSYIFTQPTDTLLNLRDMANGTGTTKVKVQYTDNPAWLMMETLPAVAKGCSSNAISLSTAVYANIVAATLKDTAVVAENEALLKQLADLQRADGSFSWWKGMEGSVYMTTAVAKTLSRLNAIAGQQSTTKQMLDRAFAYLKTEMTKQVDEMKRDAKKKGHTPHISTTALDWLYALTIEGRNGGEAADYLRKLIAKDMNKADMQTKAVAAIVLYHNGEKAKARQFAEAIKQHTVYREDVGRYFDSYRAEYHWCDYRIPTQSMAIEALRSVTPEDRQTITQMQRWLLSSKHTQLWDTPYNTVNAVHAFFCGDKSVLTTAKGDTTLVDKTVAPTDVQKAEAFAVPVHKTSTCESWAAAYVTYKQKSADIKTSSNGISVSREVIGGKNAKVGDRLKVRITVTADRDYDFVTVTDNRAACLEPVDQMSGYRGGWGNGYYAEMRDQKSCFHFNQLSKGTHTIETEYYLDRPGTYTTGSTTAVCTYAPEYRATTPGTQMTGVSLK